MIDMASSSLMKISMTTGITWELLVPVYTHFAVIYEMCIDGIVVAERLSTISALESISDGVLHIARYGNSRWCPQTIRHFASLPIWVMWCSSLTSQRGRFKDNGVDSQEVCGVKKNLMNHMDEYIVWSRLEIMYKIRLNCSQFYWRNWDEYSRDLCSKVLVYQWYSSNEVKVQFNWSQGFSEIVKAGWQSQQGFWYKKSFWTKMKTEISGEIPWYTSCKPRMPQVGTEGTYVGLSHKSPCHTSEEKHRWVAVVDKTGIFRCQKCITITNYKRKQNWSAWEIVFCTARM